MGIPILPRINECASFQQIVSSELILSDLFNYQHYSAIPVDIKKNLQVFKNVLSRLSTTCCECLTRMNDRSNDRQFCVNYLTRYLLDILERERRHIQQQKQCGDKTDFLAHQIVCDLEEIYFEPFGSVSPESVVVGYGAREGVKMCNRLLFASASRQGNSGSFTETIKALSDRIFSFMKEKTQVASHYRTMLGCQLDSSGNLSVLLNGRLLGLQDVEHYMCKLYIGVSKTLSSRGSSANPQPCKAGLHPVHFKDGGYPWDDENVRLILLDVVEMYYACRESGKIPTVPLIFLIPGEVSPE
jgi:hypothetical protein